MIAVSYQDEIEQFGMEFVFSYVRFSCAHEIHSVEEKLHSLQKFHFDGEGNLNLKVFAKFSFATGMVQLVDNKSIIFWCGIISYK